MDEWQCSTREQQAIFVEMKTAFPSGKGKGNQWAQALWSKGTSNKRKRDPDAMDVDSMTLGEEERKKLSREGIGRENFFRIGLGYEKTLPCRTLL